jgi:hypothetical protein
VVVRMAATAVISRISFILTMRDAKGLKTRIAAARDQCRYLQNDLTRMGCLLRSPYA